jgi:hypothetical protein
MDHDVSTPLRRPRLPSETRKLNGVLWREIKRGPDDLAKDPRMVGLFAHRVAETIVHDYAISRPSLEHYAVLGLAQVIGEMLQPEEEEAPDPELVRLLAEQIGETVS